MRGKLHIHWVLALIAATALTVSPMAAERSDKDNKSKAPSARAKKAEKVNLNTASKAELETLPGVGPSTADNIIAARPIKNINALKDVSGIGEERLKDIRPLVTVGSPADRGAGKGRAAASSRGTSDDDSTRRVPQRAAQPASESSSTDGDRSPREVTTGEGRRPRNPQRAGQPATAPADEDRPTRGVTTGDTRRRDVPQRAGQPAAESSSRDSDRSARVNKSADKVNINTASQEDLESLLGIGPVKAQAIIDNRPYERKEDVMKVKGIKDGTYEQIEDRITVR